MRFALLLALFQETGFEMKQWPLRLNILDGTVFQSLLFFDWYIKDRGKVGILAFFCEFVKQSQLTKLWPITMQNSFSSLLN